MCARAFVYNAVDVHNIVAISSTKQPSQLYAQVTTGLNLPVHCEHFKPNSNIV